MAEATRTRRTRNQQNYRRRRAQALHLDSQIRNLNYGNAPSTPAAERTNASPSNAIDWRQSVTPTIVPRSGNQSGSRVRTRRDFEHASVVSFGRSTSSRHHSTEDAPTALRGSLDETQLPEGYESEVY